jgi:predicted nuclease with TOPRIM domain
MEDVHAKVSALESENKSLKEIIENLDANCKALDQTVVDLLKGNISLKAGCSKLENKITKLETKNNELENELLKSLGKIGDPAQESY